MSIAQTIYNDLDLNDHVKGILIKKLSDEKIKSHSESIDLKGHFDIHCTNFVDSHIDEYPELQKYFFHTYDEYSYRKDISLIYMYIYFHHGELLTLIDIEPRAVKWLASISNHVIDIKSPIEIRDAADTKRFLTEVLSSDDELIDDYLISELANRLINYLKKEIFSLHEDLIRQSIANINQYHSSLFAESSQSHEEAKKIFTSNDFNETSKELLWKMYSDERLKYYCKYINKLFEEELDDLFHQLDTNQFSTHYDTEHRLKEYKVCELTHREFISRLNEVADEVILLIGYLFIEYHLSENSDNHQQNVLCNSPFAFFTLEIIGEWKGYFLEGVNPLHIPDSMWESHGIDFPEDLDWWTKHCQTLESEHGIHERDIDGIYGLAIRKLMYYGLKQIDFDIDKVESALLKINEILLKPSTGDFTDLDYFSTNLWENRKFPKLQKASHVRRKGDSSVDSEPNISNKSIRSVSKRSKDNSAWESNLNQIFKSHEFTPEEWSRLVNDSEQELTVDLIESIIGDFNSEIERISEHLPNDFNQNFKGTSEESSFRNHLKSLITFLYHHYLTDSFSSALLSLEKEIGNRKWGTILLKEVRDHEMMWLNKRNISEAIFEMIYPPDLEDDDKNWDILDEEWFTDGTENLFLDALNDISIDEEIALKSLKLLDELAKSSEDSIQSLDTKSFLDWLNADKIVEEEPDENKETKPFISEALSCLDLPKSTLNTLAETFTDEEFLKYSESVQERFEWEFKESLQDFWSQEDSDLIPTKIKDKYLKDLELIFKCLFFSYLHTDQIDTSHLFSIKADWVGTMELYIDDRGPSNYHDMLITLPLLREKLGKTIDEEDDEAIYEMGQQLQSFALKQRIQLEQQDLDEAVRRIQNSH